MRSLVDINHDLGGLDMKGLVLDAKWEPRPDYALSEWEKETGKAVTASSVWRYPNLDVWEARPPAPAAKPVHGDRYTESYVAK